MLQGALGGGGESRESGGGESVAAGGNQVTPGAQPGASGGAGMSSIPDRTPPEGQVGPQEESGGFNNLRGELVSSVGSGEDFGGDAVFSITKQLPRIQPPAFTGDRNSYLEFRTDLLRAASLLELKSQFVGSSRVTDITKEKLIRLGDEKKQCVKRKKQEQAYTASVGYEAGGGRKGNDHGRKKGGGGSG